MGKLEIVLGFFNMDARVTDRPASILRNINTFTNVISNVRFIHWPTKEVINARFIHWLAKEVINARFIHWPTKEREIIAEDVSEDALKGHHNL